MKSDPKYSNQRVGIFVDVQNLYHSAKNLYHGRVNYAELMKYLVGDRQLIRALAYVVKSEGIEPQRERTSDREAVHGVDFGKEPMRLRSGRGQGRGVISGVKNALGAGAGSGDEEGGVSSESAFFGALEKAGLELRMKDLQIYAGGMKKADWDVGMAVDAIRMSPFLDVVILVTGDGDFVPLIDYLKWGAGRLVEVVAFRRSASSKIQEAADKFVNVEDIPRAIMKSRG